MTTKKETKEKNLGRRQGSTNETESSSVHIISVTGDSANPNQQTRLVDTHTMAEIIGVEPHWIRRAVVEHGLPCYKYGGGWKFDIKEVLEFGLREARVAIDKRKKNGNE